MIGAGLLAFGNQVSGQVTKTGGSISSWFSKANGTGGTGGGNAGGGGGGADSRIDELKEKDPADWTLDDQKAVAEDIEKKGNSSELYSKAKDAMDAGTTWSMQLTDGSTLTYKIIGIEHDDLSDGSGKAGLTFLAAVPDISKCNERDILQAIGFTQKGDRSLKEKAAIGRDGSKQLEAVRNREGLENFDGRDFR